MSDSLLIPYALNDKNVLVNPLEAKKGEHYFCPSCRSPVIPRQGEKKVFHFAHKADCDCNQETVIHKTAKMLIVQAIESWKRGDALAPVVNRVCYRCGKKFAQPLPDKVEYAVEEYRLGKFVADLVLVRNDVPLAAVEIRVTHAVDEEKQKAMPIPFVELDGNEVVKNRAVWTPVLDKFKRGVCGTCVDHTNKVAQICQKEGIKFKEGYYIPTVVTCRKCKEEILTFDWVGRGLFSWNAAKAKPQGWPMPRTIQHIEDPVSSKGKFWVNTCPHCQSVQLYG